MIPATAVPRLKAAGVPDAARDAQVLYDWAYAQGAVAPEAQSREHPNTTTQRIYETALAERVRRRPVSQIIGKRAFWNHEFEVSSAVLDPRPDTETLVEAALAGPFSRVLDLGTGSGCIVLSLLAERAGAVGVATDLSQTALAVAKRNAEALSLGDRVAFLVSDWFASVSGRYDLIVSNPPYISAADFEEAMPEVRDWEPHLALTPGGDGLDAYRAICAGASDYLAPAGRLILEIGYDQAQPVTALCAGAGLTVTGVLDDLNGKPRVVCAAANP